MKFFTAIVFPAIVLAMIGCGSTKEQAELAKGVKIGSDTTLICDEKKECVLSIVQKDPYFDETTFRIAENNEVSVLERRYRPDPARLTPSALKITRGMSWKIYRLATAPNTPLPEGLNYEIVVVPPQAEVLDSKRIVKIITTTPFRFKW
jgi:hypothetical protein